MTEKEVPIFWDDSKGGWLKPSLTRADRDTEMGDVKKINGYQKLSCEEGLKVSGNIVGMPEMGRHTQKWRHWRAIRQESFGFDKVFSLLGIARLRRSWKPSDFFSHICCGVTFDFKFLQESKLNGFCARSPSMKRKCVFHCLFDGFFSQFPAGVGLIPLLPLSFPPPWTGGRCGVSLYSDSVQGPTRSAHVLMASLGGFTFPQLSCSCGFARFPRLRALTPEGDLEGWLEGYAVSMLRCHFTKGPTWEEAVALLISVPRNEAAPNALT